MMTYEEAVMISAVYSHEDIPDELLDEALAVIAEAQREFDEEVLQRLGDPNYDPVAEYWEGEREMLEELGMI